MCTVPPGAIKEACCLPGLADVFPSCGRPGNLLSSLCCRKGTRRCTSQPWQVRTKWSGSSSALWRQRQRPVPGDAQAPGGWWGCPSASPQGVEGVHTLCGKSGFIQVSPSAFLPFPASAGILSTVGWVIVDLFLELNNVSCLAVVRPMYYGWRGAGVKEGSKLVRCVCAQKRLTALGVAEADLWGGSLHLEAFCSNLAALTAKCPEFVPAGTQVGMLPPGLGGNRMLEEPSFGLENFAPVLASVSHVAGFHLAFLLIYRKALPPVHGSTGESLGGELNSCWKMGLIRM